MRTLAETGLTAAQYNALLTEYGAPSYRVLVYNYRNLVDASVPAAPNNFTYDVEENAVHTYAISYGGVWRTWTGYNNPFTNVGSLPANALPEEKPAIGADGTMFRFFCITTTGIYMADPGPTLNWTLMAAITDATCLMPVSPTEIYYFRRISPSSETYSLRRFIIGQGEGTLDLLWWTKPQSGDAVRLVNNPKDVLVIASDYQGAAVVHYEENTLKRYVERGAGIFAFEVYGNIVGEKRVIDAVSPGTPYSRRINVTASLTRYTGYEQINVCFLHQEGQPGQGISIPVFSASTDGRYWSIPNDLGAVTSYNATVIPLSNHGYTYIMGQYYFGIVSGMARYRFLSSYLFNFQHVNTITGHAMPAEVTPYVSEISVTLPENGIGHASLVFHKPMPDESPAYWVFTANSKWLRSLVFYIEAGWKTSQGEVRLPIGTFYEDSRQIVTTPDSNNKIVFSCSNKLRQIDLDLRSHNAVIMAGHVLGRDRFNNYDGSMYGALRHTAIWQGDFRSNGSELTTTVANGDEAIAITTFVQDARNFEFTVGFTLRENTTAMAGSVSGLTNSSGVPVMPPFYPNPLMVPYDPTATYTWRGYLQPQSVSSAPYTFTFAFSGMLTFMIDGEMLINSQQPSLYNVPSSVWPHRPLTVSKVLAPGTVYPISISFSPNYYISTGNSCFLGMVWTPPNTTGLTPAVFNGETIGYYMTLNDVWQQANINLTPTRYAGLIFRALNRDFFWYARYVKNIDRVVLGVRMNGQDYEIAQSAVLNWVNALHLTRYITVRAVEGLICVYGSHLPYYTSADLLIEHVETNTNKGVADNRGLVPLGPFVAPASGACGYIAKGT